MTTLIISKSCKPKLNSWKIIPILQVSKSTSKRSSLIQYTYFKTPRAKSISYILYFIYYMLYLLEPVNDPLLSYEWKNKSKIALYYPEWK